MPSHMLKQYQSGETDSMGGGYVLTRMPRTRDVEVSEF